MVRSEGMIIYKLIVNTRLNAKGEGFTVKKDYSKSSQVYNNQKFRKILKDSLRDVDVVATWPIKKELLQVVYNNIEDFLDVYFSFFIPFICIQMLPFD